MDDRGAPFQSLAAAARAVKSKAISPVELTQFYLERITSHDPGINAFITVTAECALADARAAEQAIMARVKSMTSTCVRPVFVNGDHVVIRWIFHFELPNDTAIHMEELDYQRWEGERIAEETFFYDPAQRTPK